MQMKEYNNLLKMVSDGLRLISQGVEAISEKIEEVAKSQTAEESKRKTSRPAPSGKKAAAKKPAKTSQKKTAAVPTAVETVYKIIGGSKKGVDTATLMKKTGFDRKKIANIIYKLGKQGKIKSSDKGVYVKV
jgi:hypothetical protein